MKDESRAKRSRRARVLRAAAIVTAAVLLAALCGFFALLVKVKGNLSYVYNYFFDTRGSLPAVQYTYEADASEEHVPHAVEQTEPDRYLAETKIVVNDTVVPEYDRENKIAVQDSGESRQGILTFRGSYRRDVSSFGTSAGAGNALAKSWQVKTGRFLKDDGVNYWSGNGWTGQPLAVAWTREMKERMNLYPAAKAKEGLVEIIYPGMDGWIHFLDMETGEATRDAINVGMTFKGTCSLHPEYPLLVCGSGDSATGPFGEQVSARIFLYSLIDGKKLYEWAANDPFAPRRWHGFDSSPIFAVEADTVIAPGENGVLYTVRLNTSFDETSGELQVSPDETVRYIYDSNASRERYEASESDIGSGSESSAVIWENYLFFGDNGGIFQCLDLNTMKPVWVQDLREDINSSPVLESGEDGRLYLYVGTTLKYHTDSHHIGTAGIYKLDAFTGQILWYKPYEVHTVSGLAGGVLASGALGSGKASGYIYYAISKTPSVDTGYLVALRTDTGEEAWRVDLPCDAWSSGCLVYTKDGDPRLVQCCGNGDILLLDALTGKQLDKLNYGANIESTPVIFGSRIVVGLRSEYIIGAEIK